MSKLKDKLYFLDYDFEWEGDTESSGYYVLAKNTIAAINELKKFEPTAKHIRVFQLVKKVID